MKQSGSCKTSPKVEAHNDGGCDSYVMIMKKEEEEE